MSKLGKRKKYILIVTLIDAILMQHILTVFVAMAMYGSDHDRYFFTMAAREAQARRTTPSGFWKPTGTKKTIFVVAGGHEVPTAVKRRFVFYLGHHQPSGSNNNNKTSWIMHEYRLMNSPRAAVPSSSSVNRLPTDDQQGPPTRCCVGSPTRTCLNHPSSTTACCSSLQWG